MRENEGGVDMALIKCPECGKEISDADVSYVDVRLHMMKCH